MNPNSMPSIELAVVDYDPFTGAPLAQVVPTTEPQREIWLADQLGREASLAYNESISLRFSGKLDTGALQKALQDLVSRHDALRATVSANGEELYIASEIALDVGIADHSASSALEQEAIIAAAKRRVVETPFLLDQGPLIRAEILKLDASEHLLIVTAHHIVCDGWSFGVLIRDLADLYAAQIGRPLPTRAPTAQYAEYAIAQNALLGSAQNVVDEGYWLSQFSGRFSTLDLPTDRSRAAWRTFTSRREDYDLDAELVTAVRKAGARNGASLFATLLGGFAALLHRVAGSDDVVIGITAAGQSVAGLDNLVGHCVNMLPVRLAVSSSASANELIANAQTATLDAYEHQQYTFGTLLKKLSLARDPSRLPLLSVIFNVDQALDADSVGFADLRVDFTSNPRHYENFELFISAFQLKGSLRLECQYNADLFDSATIRRWLELYREALARLAANPAATVSELMAPSETDRAQLAAWNATDRAYERGLRLGDLVQRGMRVNGTAPAVIFEGRTIRHDELNEMAWQLALRLRQMGVKPGVLIGVYLDRSIELVASLVGVILSGSAYVPLDPDYPADRLARMCEDAAIPIIVTRRAEFERAKVTFPADAQLLLLDDMQSTAATDSDRILVGQENDPAYVIFTSGSTGRPKGAMNGHRSIINRLLWGQETFDLGPGDRMVQKTPYSFDVSVPEFFWPLMTGATIVLARPQGHRDSAYLVELIRSERVTVIHFVPSMLRIFLDERDVESCTTLRLVVCSGEALPFDIVENFFKRLPGVRLANLYGPTETAVEVTAWECQPNDPARIVPIGRPIANTRMHVLDEQLRPVPIGVVGELYIGGVQVGMGYVSRPDLTAERFIADPFRIGGHLYKTGDIGRWRPNGAIEYMGRADHQVKIRGNRIELGEIEACLLTSTQVARAVVVPREHKTGDVRLVAYLVMQPGAVMKGEDLNAILKAALPEYMIPQHYVSLPGIPLLNNGKVDRKSLPTPDLPSRTAADFVAPRTELEKSVLAEMEASLGLPGISMRDDFFALGGHSLLAAQLTSRLNQLFKSHLSMRHLFVASTAERLAALIATGDTIQRKPVLRRTDRTIAPLTIMQERLWFLEQLYPGRVTYNGPSAHRLSGTLDENAFQLAFSEMMRRQPSLRTSFEGDGDFTVQRIHDNITVSLFPAENLSALTVGVRERKLMARLEELTAQTFDLSKPPLFKAHVFKLADNEHVLFFMAHHIIWDGWSFDLLYTELSALYAAFSTGKPDSLPELKVDYGDFATWHREWMQSEEFAGQLQFWRGRLNAIGEARALPTDKPRQPGTSGVGSTELITVDKGMTGALHELARNLDTTVFIVTLSIYVVLLHGFARQRHLVIGMPVRGRNSVELESIMGFFNTLLPLPIMVEPSEPFETLVRRVKAIIVDALKHPDVPLEQLAQELADTGAGVGGALYQALFSFQDARQRMTQWGGLAHQNILIFQRGATEDLGMWFVESASGLHGGLTYNTDLFTSETAQKLRERYLSLVSAVVASPVATITQLVGPADEAALTRAREAIAKPARPIAKPATEAQPSTETEKILAELWCQQLKLPHVNTTDNFFDLGGHSLLAMQSILAMEQKTGKRVDRSRFIFETLAQIAKSYDDAKPAPPRKPGGLRGLFSGLLGGKKS